MNEMSTEKEDLLIEMVREMREDLASLLPRVAVIEAQIAIYIRVAGVFGALGGALASWGVSYIQGGAAS